MNKDDRANASTFRTSRKPTDPLIATVVILLLLTATACLWIVSERFAETREKPDQLEVKTDG